MALKKIWHSSKSNIEAKKDTKLSVKLTYKNLQTLRPGTWLNDEVINGYIELMNNKLLGRNVRIMDSFFATNTLNKSPEMIERALARKNIKKWMTLVIPINTGAHWFMCAVKNHKVTLYDSLRTSLQKYNTVDIFQKLLYFLRWFYGDNH